MAALLADATAEMQAKASAAVGALMARAAAAVAMTGQQVKAPKAPRKSLAADASGGPRREDKSWGSSSSMVDAPHGNAGEIPAEGEEEEVHGPGDAPTAAAAAGLRARLEAADETILGLRGELLEVYGFVEEHGLTEQLHAARMAREQFPADASPDPALVRDLTPLLPLRRAVAAAAAAASDPMDTSGGGGARSREIAQMAAIVARLRKELLELSINYNKLYDWYDWAEAERERAVQAAKDVATAQDARTASLRLEVEGLKLDLAIRGPPPKGERPTRRLSNDVLPLLDVGEGQEEDVGEGEGEDDAEEAGEEPTGPASSSGSVAPAWWGFRRDDSAEREEAPCVAALRLNVAALERDLAVARQATADAEARVAAAYAAAGAEQAASSAVLTAALTAVVLACTQAAETAATRTATEVAQAVAAAAAVAIEEARVTGAANAPSDGLRERVEAASRDLAEAVRLIVVVASGSEAVRDCIAGAARAAGEAVCAAAKAAKWEVPEEFRGPAE